MKRFSLHNILLVTATLLLSVLFSCSNESELTPNSEDATSVKIQFSISNSGFASTRATEPEEGETTENGVDDLNENKIDYLDLYLFNADGSFYTKTDESSGNEVFDGHLSCDAHDFTISDAASGTLKRVGTWNEGVLNLEWSDFVGRSVYLIANWDVPATISDEASLKAYMADTIDTPNAKRVHFLMDGSVTNISRANVTGGVFNIDIARSLAKIRLKVLDKDGENITFTGLTTTANDATTTTPLKYQLANYAQKATLIDDGGTYAKTVTLHDYPKTGSTEQLTDLTKANVCVDDNRAVFYSYPNYWYNGATNIYEEEPIDEDRQTYILLYAPFTDSDDVTTWGYYKLPVNYRLQQDNDKVGVTVDENLYQLKRNHLYSITAKIDCKGGATPDDPTIIICDWEEGETIDIDYDSEFITTQSSSTSKSNR